jgi:hypothetical protein
MLRVSRSFWKPLLLLLVEFLSVFGLAAGAALVLIGAGLVHPSPIPW